MSIKLQIPFKRKTAIEGWLNCLQKWQSCSWTEFINFPQYNVEITDDLSLFQWFERFDVHVAFMTAINLLMYAKEN